MHDNTNDRYVVFTVNYDYRSLDIYHYIDGMDRYYKRY